MPDAQYEWWIDQKVRDEDGILHVTRLLHHGPFKDEKAAERHFGRNKSKNRGSVLIGKTIKGGQYL